VNLRLHIEVDNVSVPELEALRAAGFPLSDFGADTRDMCENCNHNLAYQAPEVTHCPACGRVRKHFANLPGMPQNLDPNSPPGSPVPMAYGLPFGGPIPGVPDPSPVPPSLANPIASTMPSEDAILRTASAILAGQLAPGTLSGGGPGMLGQPRRRPDPQRIEACAGVLMTGHMLGQIGLGPIGTVDAVTGLAEQVLAYLDAGGAIPTTEPVVRQSDVLVPPEVRAALDAELLAIARECVSEWERIKTTHPGFAEPAPEGAPIPAPADARPPRPIALVEANMRQVLPHLLSLLLPAGGLVNYAAQVINNAGLPAHVAIGMNSDGSLLLSHLARVTATTLVGLCATRSLPIQPYVERDHYAPGADPCTLPAPGMLGVDDGARRNPYDNMRK
jgi:hypothetical protein